MEEHYYIVFPLLLMALWRWRRNRMLAGALCTVERMRESGAPVLN